MIFRNLLNNLEDWGKVAGPFQFSNLLISLITTHTKISEFNFFEKGDKGHLKMASFNY